MTRFVHFNPQNPPDAIDEVDTLLDDIEDRLREMRGLLETSPLDVGRLKTAAEWLSYTASIEDEARKVAALADDVVAS